MVMERIGYIDLPPHATGGFDHAAVHRVRGLLYVAHTANDAVDVTDRLHEPYVRPLNPTPRVGPNGLADDANHRLRLAANVGDPSRRGSFTVSLVDVGRGAVSAHVPVPGRARWTVFDEETRRQSGRLVARIARPPDRPDVSRSVFG
jgi:hypothetical protein